LGQHLSEDSNQRFFHGLAAFLERSQPLPGWVTVLAHPSQERLDELVPCSSLGLTLEAQEQRAAFTGLGQIARVANLHTLRYRNLCASYSRTTLRVLSAGSRHVDQSNPNPARNGPRKQFGRPAFVRDAVPSASRDPGSVHSRPPRTRCLCPELAERRDGRA